MSGADEPVATEALGPGAQLARERKAQGLALADVAARLKFSERQIETLEAEDFAKMPGMAFLRGMVRSYARLLGIDSDPLLKSLEQCPISSPGEVELYTMHVPFPDGRSRSNRVYVWLSALLVIAVAVVLYEWHFGLPDVLRHFSAPQPKPPALVAPLAATPLPPTQVAPLAATPQPPPPRVAALAAIPLPSDTRPMLVRGASEVSAGENGGFGRILLEFHKNSWVEIKDRTGVVLLSQNNPAGSQRIVRGEPPFSLVIGNAEGVRLNYRNMPVDLAPHTKVAVARLTLE